LWIVIEGEGFTGKGLGSDIQGAGFRF